MCSKTGLNAKQSAGIGFGLDTLTSLVGFGDQRKDIARQNAAIQRQNQLAINTYNTKNRNAVLKWNNAKQDGDIEVDTKWRETKDAIAEAQLQAREAMGRSAIAQQQILAKMINAGQREQVGRRAGRGNIAQLGAQWAAQGAQAAFSRDSQILFQDKAGRSMAAFAQGKYVEYITGRPSPEAPPILESYRKQPSFLNTALSIASSGLNRYNQYKGNMAGKESPLLPSNPTGGDSYENYTQGAFQYQPSFEYQPSEVMTMEIPAYNSPVFGGNKSILQGEIDDYFGKQPNFNAGENLGIGLQDTFNLGGIK